MLEAKTERIRKDIEAMAQFTASPGGGMTRFSFSEEDRKTREYITSQMEAAGLTVRRDAAGNLFGRREGKRRGAPAVMLGSHFDSVKNGGAFDGPAGVVMGLEVARVLHENGIWTNLPLEFAALVEEEGGRFGGGLYGSRAMAGLLSRESLDIFRDRDGISMARAMKESGLDPDRVGEAVRPKGSLRAFIELHIEQGPILESEGLDLGFVKTIVGITQREVEIIGRADHAGTTPMDMRCNALLAASEAALFIDRAAREAGEGTVGTIGRMEVYPGGSNIVPGKVFFTIDVRSADIERLERVVNTFGSFLKDMEKKHGVTVSVKDKLTVPPVDLCLEILGLFEEEAGKLGYSAKVMQSGAGHDAMIMASITDAGLLFVPSRGGRSHCPEEWTDYEQIKKGVDVIIGTVLALAEASS